MYILGISILSLFLRFFYCVLEQFRQCAIFVFHIIIYLFNLVGAEALATSCIFSSSYLFLIYVSLMGSWSCFIYPDCEYFTFISYLWIKKGMLQISTGNMSTDISYSLAKCYIGFLVIMQAICSPALLQPNSRPFIVAQQTTNIKGVVQ